MGQGNQKPQADIGTLTYSSETTFRNCRRKYLFRQELLLAPIGREDENLYLGDLWHGATEVRDLSTAPFTVDVFRREPSDATLGISFIGSRFASVEPEPWRTRTRHVLRAMFRAYVRRWSPVDGEDPLHDNEDDLLDSNFETIDVEMPFALPVINPDSDRPSRSFKDCGKIDRIVRYKRDGRLYVWERKTAKSVGGDYVDRLWTDAQIQRYAAAASIVLNEPVVGAVYDVAAKPGLKQREELRELPEDHMARFLTEIAKKKASFFEKKRNLKKPLGDPEIQVLWDTEERPRVEKLKSLAPKFRPAETDEQFAKRLDEWCSQRGAFFRLFVIFDGRDLEEARADTWEISQQILDARRRGKWSRNRSQCYAFGRGCDFVGLCKANVDPMNLDENLVGAMFETREPHSELAESEASKWFYANAGKSDAELEALGNHDEGGIYNWTPPPMNEPVPF